MESDFKSQKMGGGVLSFYNFYIKTILLANNFYGTNIVCFLLLVFNVL